MHAPLRARTAHSTEAEAAVSRRRATRDGSGHSERLNARPQLRRIEAAAAQLNRGRAAREASPVAAANRTGLPDRLKAGVEKLSGLSLDDVRVHRNSSRPAALGALAFAEGADIHLGPGQAHHLAHEAWHVVQQKQGRVRPLFRLAGAAINDDPGLEREADRMGAAALVAGQAPSRLRAAPAIAQRIVQRATIGSLYRNGVTIGNAFTSNHLGAADSAAAIQKWRTRGVITNTAVTMNGAAFKTAVKATEAGDWAGAGNYKSIEIACTGWKVRSRNGRAVPRSVNSITVKAQFGGQSLLVDHLGG